MDVIYEPQASVLKTLANAHRLEIIHRLAEDGPCEVQRLASEIGIAQPNVSQHLAVMRAAGVVERDRVGRQVTYRLADPNIVRACGLMREVLEQHFLRLAQTYRIQITGDDASQPASAGMVCPSPM
jgi:DNA-binding transcriptional ArsR family regulator